MRSQFLSCVVAALVLSACATTPSAISHYVDPNIGTGGHGHVFLGASVPFGLVQLGPTSLPQTWDWTSGYHVTDSTIIGFPHTHLSGTGIGDLHDVTVMPVVGDVTYARGTEEDPRSGLWSYADRTKQVVKPGYFATRLRRYNIDVALTATKRVGFHKYTFPASEKAAIVFDLENGGTWDKATEVYISALNDSTITGYRYSTGWAKDQRVYFVAQFSKPFTKIDTGKVLYARAAFTTREQEAIYVKVALSPTSIDNAKQNMAAELPGWDFEATVAAADKAWNDELSKIKIETTNDTVRSVFYTALYHTMIAPSEFCDMNGDYFGADLKVHHKEGFTNYTTLPGWDFYRSDNSLWSLIHAEKMGDLAATFISIYQQQGKLPVWHLMGNETNTMVGNPGICILADAILKGYVKDENTAYEALKQSAMLDERGMNYRKEYGYIPFDKMVESVACDMEYAIADWSLAQVAQRLHKTDDYEYFLNRSKSYKHFFDPATGFMRGKSVNGQFHVPFDPVKSQHRADDYCEGNAWQYTFLVPHDLPGLINCFGSKAAFEHKLDSLFMAASKITGEDLSPDISGLIGQYAHGNEPSHHIIYYYTMIGQPGKAADRIRQVLATLYHQEPDGLSGNEDVGAMSSWYIMSSLGFYQVEPAGGRYFFGSPLVDKATLKVRDGELKIIARNNSPVNKYIQKITLNGKPYHKNWIAFADLAAGGQLEFEMGSVPDATWCHE